MPIPKWCDRKSIRTVKRGGARILICCRKGKWKAGRCTVGTRAIDVTSGKLIKGARIERREHPSFTAKQAKRIASDHLRANPRAYGSMVSEKRIRGAILMDAVSKHGAATYLHEDEIARMVVQGLIKRVSEHKAIATEKGREAFTSGKW